MLVARGIIAYSDVIQPLLVPLRNGGTVSSSVAVQIEYETMPHPVGFAVFCSVWLLAAAWAWRRWKEFANSPYNWIEFEDRPAADIESPTPLPNACPRLRAVRR